MTGGEIAARTAEEVAGTIIVLVATISNTLEEALSDRHTRIVLPKGEGNMTPDKGGAFDTRGHFSRTRSDPFPHPLSKSQPSFPATVRQPSA